MVDPAWEKELYGYMWGKTTALECIPHAINGMSDHLDVVFSIPPRLAIATIIGQLKSASSHYINEQFLPGNFSAQVEYSVFSISESALEKVVRYVNNQKQHHAVQTLIDLLETTPD